MRSSSLIRSIPGGKRLFSAGNPGLVLNFQFNNARDFALILDTSLHSSTLDPHSGIADICIASFLPARDLRFPPPATHFRFFAAAIAIDFDKLTFHKDISDSGPPSHQSTPFPCDQPGTSDSGKYRANMAADPRDTI